MITIKGDGFCIKRQAVTSRTIKNIFESMDFPIYETTDEIYYDASGYYAVIDKESTPVHIIINIKKKGVEEDAQ